MKNIRQKIKIFLISKLIKEDDKNHLLFLYTKHPQLNKFLTIGELSSGIFHDLFTPISSLSLMIDHFEKEGVFDEHKLKKSLIESKNELNSLVLMIQEYLKENTKLEEISISNIIEQSIRFFSYKITKSNIKISFIRESGIKTKTNRLRLLQVIINIISNSINSFDSLDSNNKSISLSVYKKRNNIKILIQDTGSGIPRKIIKKIYSPLFTTRNNGIGLGLSTTKNIIKNELSGSIKILSKENKGTKVLITLPKK